jgi:hypothetical protein
MFPVTDVHRQERMLFDARALDLWLYQNAAVLVRCEDEQCKCYGYTRYVVSSLNWSARRAPCKTSEEVSSSASAYQRWSLEAPYGKSCSHKKSLPQGPYTGWAVLWKWFRRSVQKPKYSDYVKYQVRVMCKLQAKVTTKLRSVDYDME